MFALADQEEETYSVIFSSLKHPARRKILRLLADSPRTFSEILGQVDVDSSHLSYHLDSLKELLKKEDGRYSLSDFSVAAASLMSKVEEPEKRGSPLRKSVAKIHPKLLFVLLVSLLVVAVLASMYFQSLNGELVSTIQEERWRVAGHAASSMRKLSAMYTSLGWGPPVTSWTRIEEYSNISLVDIGVRQIFENSDLAHLSMLQLIQLDPSNKGYYEKIDGFFLSLLNFSRAMERLFSENKTSDALAFIERLYDSIRDKPAQLSEYFSNGYTYLNRVDTYALELSSETSSVLQTIVNSIMEDVYKKFPWVQL